MKKKDNKITIVVIMLIVVIVLGVVLFICYNGDTFNKNSGEEKTEVKKEKLALDDERFIGVYEALKEFTYSTVRADGYNSFMDDDLNVVCVGELVNTDFTDTGEFTEFGTKYYSFDGSKCDDVVRRYFGNATSFNKENLVGKTLKIGGSFPEGDGMNIESYDANTDTYKVQFSSVGGLDSPSAKVEERKLISAELEGDEITVVENAIYTMSDFSAEDKIVYTIYSDPDLTDVVGTKTYTSADVANQTISIDDYLDNCSVITYKFKLNKETNEYYFVSSIIE